jgi:flagellar hook assembly protein FlgD
MTSAGRIDVVGERINQNTVWRKWPAPYNVVSGTVSVHKDATNAATLTIDPGVTIKFASNSGLQVGDNANQGSLIAQGTPGDRIVLTRSGTSGTWPGITFNDKTVDATTILEYADIQYTAEMKMNSSSPTIRNSTITDMSGYLNLSFSSPVLDTVTISNNGSYGIYIFGTLSAPVITNGSLTNANSTGQGIVGYGSPVISNYSVSIVNTAGKYGIRLDVTSSTFSLSNSTIGNGIYLGSTGITPTIAGNTFTNLDASPVHLGANLIGGLVSNNTLSGLTNAGKIEVVGETINRDGQWQKLDAPYVVSGSIAVFKDATTAATLVLDPGVVLKFDSGAGMQIGAGTQRGVLVAKGTAVQPIVFTSSQSTPVAGNWTGLTFSGSGSSQSEMEYGTVEYAGSGANSSNANVKLDASAPLFRNCVIRYSAGSGIYLTNSANWAVVLDSEISNNKWGVYSSSSNPYITNTRITGNTTAGIWNASTTVDVDARDNWWGLSTGPTHSTNPSGTGDRISDHVLYNPWLGQTPGTTLSITEAKVMPASLNPDGDNVTFVAAISAQANWTVTITDSNNDSVKIFTGTGTDINQRWYGEDSQSLKVADGVYYYKIDATDPANGNVASWPRGMVMVSRQIPIAIIDAPTDNQQFVGGTPVTIMGTASDSTNFSNYTLAYGPSENPTSWINLKTSSTPTTSGLIHIWNTTALSSSVYTLRLTVNDTAGNIATETARVRFSWIQNVTVSEAYISPNGDGIKDSTLISATFTQQANWTVTIKNSSGLGVRSYSGVGSSMSQSWDGKDEGGQAVPDGVYSYRIDAMGGFVTGPVVVDRTSPVALITPPGASAWNTVQVIGSASDENIDTYRLEFGPASGEGPWNLISSATNSVSGGTLGTWVTNDQTNTVVIPNDGYQIRLTVSDKAGNTMLATMSVTVDNLILSNISISRNNLNTANSETTSASFTVSGPSTVTLKIIPEKQGPSGAPVYQNSQNLVSAATGSFIWDGKDSAGTVVPDETYLYLVEASDGTKTDSYNPPAAAGTGSVTCTQDSYDPYKNDPMTISYTPSRPSRINISIAWGGQYFKVLDAVGRAAGSYTYDWDGRNAGGKILPETAVASCSVASLLRENHIVTTGDAISITDLKTDPYGIHLAYGQFTRIKYALNRDALVTVTIISPQGTSSVVLNSQLNSSGAHEVVWNGVATADGKEFVVSEEGDYIVTVQAVNPLTGTVSTKRGGLRIKF